MALNTLVATRPLSAAPADIFSVGAPAIGSEPPKAASIKVGDASVSTQTGALQYGYPIAVPPGRHGMQPSLALSYSSQAPIYGGIAAGWSLSIPIITLDTSTGRLWQQTSTVKNYTSSMAGGRPLIPVDEPKGGDAAASYRAQNDSTFTRYERMVGASTFRWRARALDGSTYYFGDADHVGNCAIVSDEYAPLTRHVDAFGNAVEYVYGAGVDGECRIETITWGQNANANIAAFAKVQFIYASAPELCAGVPVGAQTSYRTGTKVVTGASRLNSIIATAFPPGGIAGPADHTRVITLSYSAADASCTASHGAFRSLTSIQESAWGTDSPRVDLPAVLFTYGDPSPPYPAPTSAVVPWSGTLGESGGNLTWGYRFVSTGQWPSVEAMMLDVDGDGRLDRVTNDPLWENGGVKRCRARWERNLGTSSASNPPSFALPQYIDMPTLKWASTYHAGDAVTPDSSPYIGGAYANANNSETQGREGCHLNYQETAYANSDGNNGFYSCPPPDSPTCPASGTCAHGRDCDFGLSTPRNTILAFRWVDLDGDGLVDIVASPADGGQGNYDLQHGTGVHAIEPPPEPLASQFPLCPVTPFPSGEPGKYTMCGHMFPWLIYKNHGNGQFGQATHGGAPLPDKIMYEPIPLEPNSTDTSLTSSPTGGGSTLADIDSDGYLDGVLSGANAWRVYRNDGTGQLLPAAGASAFTWAAGASDSVFKTACYPLGVCNAVTTQGLLDVNGDGLDDHWSEAGSGSTDAQFEISDGASFRVGNGSGEVTTSRPGTDSTAYGLRFESHFTDTYITAGYRQDANRVYDFDGDGRVDALLAVGDMASAWHHLIHFNQGGAFDTGQTTTGNADGGAKHAIVVADSTGYSWAVRSDLIDLDGDGIAESVDFGHAEGNQGTQLAFSRISTSSPRRVLNSINNQRGAVTYVAYAPTTDSNIVEQDPAAGRVMPHVQWVVKSVTVADNLPTLAATTSTTTYHYKNPIFSPEMDRIPDGGITVSDTKPGKYGFRGFEEVTTTGPSGAQTVQRYDYSVDWSGRLHTSLVVPAENPGTVSSIDETSWERHDLFCDVLGGCQVRTFHAAVTDHWTCSNGQSESACRLTAETGPSHHVRTINTLSPLSSTTSGGPVLAWGVTSSRLQDSADPGEGDRITDTAFIFPASATEYQLLTQTVTKNVIVNASPVMFGRTATEFDSTAHWLPSRTEVWFSDVDPNDPDPNANRAITRFAYDTLTGNLTRRWKPVQNAGNGHSAAYSYDTRLLFVTSETQEPAGAPTQSMVLDYTWEYGTGTKLVTLGPNIPTCATTVPNTCNGTPLKEQHKIRVDGLGRTIERYGAWTTDATRYPQFLLERFTYDDSAFKISNLPTNVVHELGLNADANGVVTYARDKTEVDGHGRPIKKTVYVQGTAPADEISTYVYRNDGTLSSMSVPDPTANNASVVTYTYGFDSLGRPTSMRRPDAAPGGNPSGVDMSYDGLTTTTTEHVGNAGGKVTSTITIKDTFGRLVEVREQTSEDPSTPSWAVTTYSYDAANNVNGIADPEGVTTRMEHDFAGHRTSITRGTRTWKYAYDKNGNMVSETVPGYAADGHDIADYTTTIAYDDLDRPVSKLLAHRNLSAPDLALFGADHETYTWDYNINRKGHLYSWAAYGPNASGTNYAVQYQLSWDAMGTPWGTQIWFNAAGYPNLVRTFGLDHYMNGMPRLARYYDDANMTFATTSIDARGLPSQVQITGTTGITQMAAQQTRNVAGLVTKSRTNVTGGGPMTFIESNWTYDKLGRVTSQVVQKGPGPLQVAREDLTYFGNDDPKSVDHYLGSDLKHFEYTYDSRHQLKHAIETTTPGYFDGTYSYGEAGRFASAAESSSVGGALPPGSTLKPRDVSYVYVDGLQPGHPYGDLATHPLDPEAPLILQNNSNGQPFASYDYDAAGNDTFRCLGTITSLSPPTCTGESWGFLYDGKDQLRRVKHFSDTGALLGSEEYWYDSDGKRIATVARDAQNIKTGLTYWIGDVEAHYDGTGAFQNAYSYISLGMPVARLDRANNKFEFLFHGLGDSTLAAVERSTGEINTSFRYAPFGSVLEATDNGGVSGTGASAHARRFNDKYVDDISGNTYYGARYFDPISTAWTQSDPLYRFVPDLAAAIPRRANLYVFSLQNPLRYRDPDGRNAVQNDPSNPCPKGALCEDPQRPDGEAHQDGNWDYGNVDSSQLDERMCGGCPQFRNGVSTTGAYAVVAKAIARPAAAAAVAPFCLNCALLIELSGARNHNETVMPLVAWGGAHLVKSSSAENATETTTEVAVTASKSAKPSWTKYLDEAAGRVKAAKAQYGDGLEMMSRKSDIRFIDKIAKKLGLNRDQRRLLHDFNSKQGLTEEEIIEHARDIQLNMPKGNR